MTADGLTLLAAVLIALVMVLVIAVEWSEWRR